MLLLALDDTDTRHQGCTTHTAYQIAQAIEQAQGALAGWGLVGPARLVRLNPAAEHRTRGNGAIALPLGRRDSAAIMKRIGSTENGDAIGVPAQPPTDRSPPPAPALQALGRLVLDLLPPAGPAGHDPQPAALLLERPPPARLYERAVVRTLTLDEAWHHAPRGTRRLTPAGRRGEIGALGAAAWPAGSSSYPNARWSWEFIAYREPTDTKRARDLPPGFTARLEAIPGGFDNVDRATGRIRAVPRTPCPVRFAARGLDPDALVDQLDHDLDQDATPCGGWLVRSNQATGDHARWASAHEKRHGVVVCPVTITGPGARHAGGHLFVPARSKTSGFTLAAYEPTKSLRLALQATAPGDRLTVLARTGDDPHVLALEALRVDHLVPRHQAGPNPRCPQCVGATKSRGRDAGYRCPRCRTRFPEHDRPRLTLDPAPLHAGARFQVPDAVRGHLLPPLEGLPAARDLDGRRARPVPPVLDSRGTCMDDPPTPPNPHGATYKHRQEDAMRKTTARTAATTDHKSKILL